jgi:hypothetical protein
MHYPGFFQKGKFLTMKESSLSNESEASIVATLNLIGNTGGILLEMKRRNLREDPAEDFMGLILSINILS